MENPVSSRAVHSAHPGRGPIASAEGSQEHPEALEIAGSGLYGHPILAQLVDVSASEFRAPLVSVGSSAAEASASISEGADVGCETVLTGTSILTRIARLPADLDMLIYLAVEPESDDPVRAAEAHTGAIIAFLTALADSVRARRCDTHISFVCLNIYIPLTHPSFPGEFKTYRCPWSHEDMHIGPIQGSLGPIEMRESLERGGQPVLSLSMPFKGVQALIDIRIDPYLVGPDGPLATVLDAQSNWAGGLASSARSTALPREVERAMLRKNPGSTAGSAALRRRESHAILKLSQRRFPKALKYALQGLAFGGEIGCAMQLAPFLRSRVCTAAALGSRLSNLVTPVRRRWAEKSVFFESAQRLCEQARPLCSEEDPSGLPPPPDRVLRETLGRWEGLSRSDAMDPRTWAGLEHVASDLKALANEPALEFLRGRVASLAPMPRFRAAVEGYRKP